MSIPETIFDKIIAGDIPCHKVYEDDLVLSFLDIAPLAPGHTLIIPKERKIHLHELSDESAAAIGRLHRHPTAAVDGNIELTPRRHQPPRSKIDFNIAGERISPAGVTRAVDG